VEIGHFVAAKTLQLQSAPVEKNSALLLVRPTDNTVVVTTANKRNHRQGW